MARNSVQFVQVLRDLFSITSYLPVGYSFVQVERWTNNLLFCSLVSIKNFDLVDSGHRCHRIRAFSSGIVTPSQYGITRAV